MTINLQNSVRVALCQTGLLVTGILAVAASSRAAKELGHPDLRDFLFFVNHGWLLLPVPVIWIAATAGVLLDRARSLRRFRAAVFLAGPTLLVVLATALTVELIEPWRSGPVRAPITAGEDL